MIYVCIGRRGKMDCGRVGETSLSACGPQGTFGNVCRQLVVTAKEEMLLASSRWSPGLLLSTCNAQDRALTTVKYHQC